MTQQLQKLILKNQKNEIDEFDEAVSILSKRIGWHKLLQGAYKILSSVELKTLWYDSACCLYYAASDNLDIPIPVNECIARLYWCLSKYPDLGDAEHGFNLVWSITCSIKRISYNSSWEPLNDADIQYFIKKFED